MLDNAPDYKHRFDRLNSQEKAIVEGLQKLAGSSGLGKGDVPSRKRKSKTFEPLQLDTHGAKIVDFRPYC
jgi:hypothetical protein